MSRAGLWWLALPHVGPGHVRLRLPRDTVSREILVLVMQELFGQLDEAKCLLKQALGKYLAASYAIQKFYQQSSSAGIPLELSNRITAEFSSLASSETDLGKIKSIIGQVRNHYHPVVPIHLLPLEVMNRIFSLVVGARPCGVKERSGEIITFPKYPDLLAHVCSRWRQIALNQPSLWSHVDIVPFHNMSPGFHARARAAATRTALLDIHCYEPSFSRHSDESSTYQLLEEIGPQIRSLELVAPATSDAFELNHILANCLEQSVPGVFKQLTMANLTKIAPVFWQARDYQDDDSDDSGMFDLDALPPLHRWLLVSPDDLENILLPVTVLRLDGTYFPWSHPVYRDLTELSLAASREPGTSVAESGLVDILTCSPRLESFHFGLSIRAGPSSGTSREPVSLQHLRTLKLAPKEHRVISSVLRLLAPGQNALKLSLRFSSETSQVYDDGAMQFFERSNVEILYAGVVYEPSLTELMDGASIVYELIRPLRRLRILALQNFCTSHTSGLAPGSHRGLSGPEHRLEAVYILNSVVTLASLQQLIQRHPANTVTFWRTSARNGEIYLSGKELETAFISDNCRFISVDYERPSPIAHWD